MPNPRRRKHRFTVRGRQKPRKPRKARSPNKAPAQEKEPSETVEAVRHYGDAWDYEAYEKEELKAKGLFL
jgi:hypothetical protein